MNLFSVLAEDDLGGPLDLIFGLPVHPLVVHGAVVLMPLVAIAGLVMSYWPSFSRRYGGLTVIVAGIAQVAMFVAKASGEPLQKRLDMRVVRHADFGQIAPFLTLPLVVLIFLRWRMDRSGAQTGSPQVRRMLSVALFLSSILALVIVYLTGHSGAEAVWGSIKNR